MRRQQAYAYFARYAAAVETASSDSTEYFGDALRCRNAPLGRRHLFLPVAEPEAEAFCSLRVPEEAEPDAEEPPEPPVVETSEAGTLQDPVVKLMVMPGPARQRRSFSGGALDSGNDQERIEALVQQARK